MVRKQWWVGIIVGVVLSGCQSGRDTLQKYADDPSTVILDPHFASYEQQVQEVERQYLFKKITYAQYLEMKKNLDDTYQGEVQEREMILNRE